MSSWSDEQIEYLKVLHPLGLSHAEIGRRLDRSRGAIAGAVWRYVLGNKTTRPTQRKLRCDTLWTEAMLTEPWAAYRARKQAERARA